MASSVNGLVLPVLSREQVRDFLRWISRELHPKQSFTFARRDVEELIDYVIHITRLIANRAEPNREGIVTPEAVTAAFESWCTDQTARINALESFRGTTPVNK